MSSNKNMKRMSLLIPEPEVFRPEVLRPEVSQADNRVKLLMRKCVSVIMKVLRNK